MCKSHSDWTQTGRSEGSSHMYRPQTHGREKGRKAGIPTHGMKPALAWGVGLLGPRRAGAPAPVSQLEADLALLVLAQFRSRRCAAAVSGSCPGSDELSLAAHSERLSFSQEGPCRGAAFPQQHAGVPELSHVLPHPLLCHGVLLKMEQW